MEVFARGWRGVEGGREEHVATPGTRALTGSWELCTPAHTQSHIPKLPWQGFFGFAEFHIFLKFPETACPQTPRGVTS